MGDAYSSLYQVRDKAMILEEETYIEYGYYPKDLSQQSHKVVFARCEECGKIRIVQKGAYRDLCRSCCRKGKRNVHYGKPLSAQQKEAVAIANAARIISKETRAKQRAAQTGNKNGNWKGGKIERKCKECGESFLISRAWIKKGGGSYCSQECKKKHLIGDRTSNWKGGISFEPYCRKFNEEFKEYIRDKFDRKCFLCDKTEEENGQKLSVHHVDYRKSCGGVNTEEEKKADDASCQFVPLCISCNTRVNFNRDLWERRIKNEMRNKLNGWYI
jgi:hypothetical protein